MADGQNTYKVVPPTGRDPPRIMADYVVDEYSEEMVDQQGNQYDATLTLVARTERETNSGYVESATNGEWEFDFHTGTIATARVHSNVGGTASTGTEGKQLRLVLENQQAQVLEESASKLNAVRVREVPDGSNLSEDNSPSDRNTVTISSPNEQVFESGDYVVQSWETEMQNDDFQQVSLTLEQSN